MHYLGKIILCQHSIITVVPSKLLTIW